MKLTTFLPAAAGLAIGYVLGTAAGRGRYRQIAAAVQTVVRHPKVQQTVFDLAGRVRSNASRMPGPAANLVDNAATQVQDTLTQPDGESA